MKLDRLELIDKELKRRLAADGVFGEIYYNYENQWHLLGKQDVDEILKPTLEKVRGSGLDYHQPAALMTWFPISEFDCVVALTFPSSPRQKTRKRFREILDESMVHALNAYNVSHNQLTSLLARDAFQKTLGGKIAQLSGATLSIGQVKIEGESTPILAIFALDIDYFKQVNDTHGHLYGDQVLKTFARRLETARLRIIAKTDGIQIELGHPSGEEFLILIYGNAGQADIIDWANIFRMSVCDEILPTDSEWDTLSAASDLSNLILPAAHERIVTTSVGIALYVTPVANDSLDAQVVGILDRADTALYRAKAAGRNRAILFDNILDTCGRVLEHTAEPDVVAIDIGSNVGVSVGQEFRVFPEVYSGQSKFTVNDGRTLRTIGTYPRVELSRITVFNVQPEISFAYISEGSKTVSLIPAGAHLEAIPVGSIGHLLKGTSRYFSSPSAGGLIPNSQELQKYIELQVNKAIDIYAFVIRFGKEAEYFKRYGSAALNVALARLYQNVTASIHGTSLAGVIDKASVCTAGTSITFNEATLNSLVSHLDEEMPELGIVAGYFNSKMSARPTLPSVNSTHSIEFARFAASDYGRKIGKSVGQFDLASAEQMLAYLREARSYNQGMADYEKLISLGVESATIHNNGGLIYSGLSKYPQSIEAYERAVKVDPKNAIYRSNVGMIASLLNEIDRGLLALNDIEKIGRESLKKIHAIGFVNYAVLLAKVKRNKSTLFNQSIYDEIRQDAIDLKSNYKRNDISILLETV